MLSMTRPEIGAFLDQQETGVFSVCADGEAYGTPESFGYRNGTLYFQFVTGRDSEKLAYLEETETVCFTVHEATAASDFASVIARGSLNRLSDGDQADLALGANAQFPSTHVFPEHDGDIEAFALEATEITGRKGPDFDIDTASAELPAVAETA